MNRIKYEVCDLGIEYPDYFQGFGVAFTEYDKAAVGIGDTFNDALADALEYIDCGVDRIDGRQLNDIERSERQDDGINSNISSVETHSRAYYHVGIRYSLVERKANGLLD